MINFSMERAQEGLQQSLIICLDASAINQHEFKEGGYFVGRNKRHSAGA